MTIVHPYDTDAPLSEDMEPFTSAQEPDEGYSEHPLYPSSTEATLSPVRHSRDPAAFMAWLSPQLSTLNVEQRKQLAMALLAALPTTTIQDIVVQQLNPRLYINFVSKLPAEICLKIFAYLDPVSLVNVARCCREWYNLSLDHKLWEQLFYLEGWQAVPKEITIMERRMNSMNSMTSSDTMHPQRMQSSEYGHVYKKRAITDPAQEAAEHDAMEIDRDDDTEMSGIGASLFGGGARVTGSTSSSKTTSSVTQHLGGLIMDSPSPIPVDMPMDRKGKGKATAQLIESPAQSIAQPSLPKSSLWTYHAQSGKYRINWQYLYTMRRRLEYNWEEGRYTNFQLPHPDYPQEGHKECVYSLQFDPDYVVSGSRDKTIRIWNLRTRRLARKPLTGHRGSVLCLQFDADPEEDLIVSGSSDSDVIIWKFSTGEKIQVLDKAHSESVLNVKFDKRILVTCSKDRSIKIFNRKPLRAGDVGYRGNIDDIVGPVPINLKDYSYDDPLLSRFPVTEPFTEIGCLEGHGAAVNAVQIYGDEIVSASGDRHIKVWDWPQQICQRTFLGHHKGIACVQYDGRRIISGSSDNEVKVFDRETGLEVATLRGHVSLVRTVQAGFGDLPYSIEEDRSTAKAIDDEYFAAVKTGTLGESLLGRGRTPNAGGRRPEDITAYGAKLPPGGGGGRYARIVSGSYDQSIIIWRRDKEGKWRRAHILQQAEAAANASRQSSRPLGHTVDGNMLSPSQSPVPSLHHNARPIARHPAPPQPPASAPPTLQGSGNMTHVEHPIHATVTPQTTTSYSRLIDDSVAQGPTALQNALTSFPTMLAYDSRIQAAIDLVPDAVTRSNLRQVVAAAIQRTQIQQNRIRESVQQAMAAPLAGQSGSQPGSNAASALPPHLLPIPRPSRQSSRSNQTTALARPHAARQMFQAPTQPSESSSNAATASTVHTTSTPLPITASITTHVSAGPPVTINHTTQNAAAQLAQQHQQTAQNVNTQALAGAPQLPSASVHHPHIVQNDQQAPRVFKLQFDAHKIICCSQTSTIVGWDFCNGDPELEEVARFFAPIE